MNIGLVTHDISTIEGLTTKARALRGQMQAAEARRALCIDRPDVITHIQMRALRREAHKTLYALENAAAIPHFEAYPQIAVPGKETTAIATNELKNAKDVLAELISTYKNSIFVKAGGKIIAKNKPKDLPFFISLSEQCKDSWMKLIGFGRKHPYQFLAISAAIIALKILFAVVVFDALDDAGRHLLGLSKRKSKKSDQSETNVTPKKLAPQAAFPPGNAPALVSQFNAPATTANINATLFPS